MGCWGQVGGEVVGEGDLVGEDRAALLALISRREGQWDQVCVVELWMAGWCVGSADILCSGENPGSSAWGGGWQAEPAPAVQGHPNCLRPCAG